MKFIKDKKLFLISIVCLIFLIIVSTLVTIKEYEDYNEKINTVLINLISNIREEYPEVSEEDIIKSLNEKSNSSYINNESTEEMLSHYGINNTLIEEVENKKYSSIKYNILIILLGFVLFLSINFIYTKKENKTIREITEYIKKLNEKKYELKIEENTENELSKLKNELYKITVMLKEEAEDSLDAKKLLKLQLKIFHIS